jgi:hypothetical protein
MQARSMVWRGLTILLATAASGTVMTAASAAGAQVRTTPGPTISDFTATPSQLKDAGGSVRLTARTTGATKCAISSNTAIKGLPTTIVCPGGHPGITVTVPGNTGSTVRSISFTMKAEAANGAYAAATLYVHVLPPAAQITSWKASASTLSASGGTVTLTGKVTRALACVITASPNNIKGLPVSVPCTSGTVTKTVSLPAATSGTTNSWNFALSAAGLGGGAPTSVLTVLVTGKAPSVTAFSVSPTTLPSSGGTVTLSITVADAYQCGFGYGWSGGSNPIGSSLPHSISCTSGTYTYKVPFAADSTKSADTVVFTALVVSGGGTVTPKETPTVVEAAG